MSRQCRHISESVIVGADFPRHTSECHHSTPINVLKLHGSLNWVVRMQGRRPSANRLTGKTAPSEVLLSRRREIITRLRYTGAGRAAARGSWCTELQPRNHLRCRFWYAATRILLPQAIARHPVTIATSRIPRSSVIPSKVSTKPTQTKNNPQSRGPCEDCIWLVSLPACFKWLAAIAIDEIPPRIMMAPLRSPSRSAPTPQTRSTPPPVARSR